MGAIPHILHILIKNNIGDNGSQSAAPKEALK
jgi:hypothetical protein